MLRAPDNISAAEMREALKRLLRDQHIEGAERLRAFLTYIVDKEIEGRGEDIRGKTIAQDVYEKDVSIGSDPENVVRVDARRIRQLLELHYQGEGRNDPVRLHLDSGGYRPRFERIALGQDETSGKLKLKSLLPAATFALGGVIGAIAVSIVLPEQTTVPAAPVAVQTKTQSTDALRRAAVYEKSPASLQALNLAEQARTMIFPIFDRPRQMLVLSVFEHVIELDPNYYGGYAGAAQALASLAIISPRTADMPDYEALALQAAEKAVQLGPDRSWSQSAKSWASFAANDIATALRLGRRATQLDPNDGVTLDFLGAVALFSGNFEEAIEIADRLSLIESGNQRFANRNASGAAHFHIGNYESTIERFDEAAALGNPLSAPSLAYAAAARGAIGRENDALVKLNELKRAWPDAQIGVMLKSMHVDDKHAEEVIEQLRRLGWSEKAQISGNID